jgi:hypothetical protein
MPRAAGPIRVASVLGEYRDGLSRHAFVGGNAFMLRMLNRYRTELDVAALPAELEAMARATEVQLAERTATVAIANPSAGGTSVSFDVDVGNLTGHKFPTGYPSRRAWLHVTVTGAGGRVVFESGRVDPTGAIDGNDSDVDGGTFEPHYEEITRGEEVQIYESIMGTLDSRPTTGLLQATQYLKDNRLLPRGFDKATAPAEIAVFGAAAADADFAAAGDRVRYRIRLTEPGAVTVTVELRYQSIGARWAQNLAAYRSAPEPRRFLEYYDSLAAGSSVVVGRVTEIVGR